MAESHDTAIALLEQQVNAHDAHLGRLTSAVESIGTALNKLAILEERHNETKASIDRAFTEMRSSRNDIEVRMAERDGRLDARLKALEGKQGKWVDVAVTALITALATAIVMKLYV